MIEWGIGEEYIGASLKVGDSEIMAFIEGDTGNGFEIQITMFEFIEQIDVRTKRMTKTVLLEQTHSSFSEAIAWTEEHMKAEMHRLIVETVEESYK